MKLLYIIPNINNEGGVARTLAIKTKVLIEKWNYEVHILTQNNGNSTPFYDFDDKIIFHDMILKGNLFQFLNTYRKSLLRLIVLVKPDVVIVSDNGLKAFAIPFLIKSEVPIVFECHGSRYIEESKEKYWLLSKGLRFLKYNFKSFGAKKFTKFVALSNESLAEWDLNNSIVIPNPSWLQPKKQAELKNKKVIAVARNSYEKGLDRLLLIWQKLAIKYPDWVLEIYGKEVTSLKVVGEKLGIDSSVSFYEPVQNIAAKYEEASIFVMTSRQEGFPMVLIEAISSGLPCIAYDCPCGPRAIIKNDVDGFLIPDGDEDVFVEKLHQLMQEEELRKLFGSKAAKSVAQYNSNSIMKQWNELFLELASKN
ncbi:glycosyltransferase involved in cell wall biosynthesis [Flavobacterium sp. 28A]|uniref:glycosyltransferase family 4 protein n=1 Tax=Flavobacterium sp. 28A TaxID=2735895 RepID=UPI00156E8C67|nr:glycosyltransferase family 4 protein [Flavobacterium sp. 28A]NRT17055.1 glycosyltransferase involved in cell wall biosynthesis [Flavobacterium sp. 28A]